jgi:hypothetical protein
MFVWTDASKPLIVVFAATMLAFSFSFPGYASQTVKWLQSGRGLSAEALETSSWVYARVFGGILLGATALCIARLSLDLAPDVIGVNLRHVGRSLIVVIVACAAMLVGFGWCSRTCPWLFAGYPSIQVLKWDRRLLLINALSWSCYLLGFEMLLRGTLLIYLANTYGNLSALIIAGAVYSLTEVAQQKQPMVQFATIFVGIGFCFLVLWTGSILGPYLIHIWAAPLFEYFAIRAQSAYTLSEDTSP